MKNIFKDSTNAINLARNKNYISIIALSAIAFNCNAWNIENQKYSIGLTEEDGHLCYKDKDTNEDTKLTTKGGASLRDSLYNCKEMVEYVRDLKNRPSFAFSDLIELYNKDEWKNKLSCNAALLNGFVLYYLAYQYFRNDISLLDITDREERWKKIKMLKDDFKFEFNITDDLKHDIDWYMDSERWGLRHWIENVKRDEHVNHSDYIECYTYDRYKALKDEKNKNSQNLHVIVDYDTLSDKQIKELQKAKSNNEIKELKIILTKKSLKGPIAPETFQSKDIVFKSENGNYTQVYEIPKGVTHVDYSILHDSEKMATFIFPSSLVKITDLKGLNLNPSFLDKPISNQDKYAAVNIAEDENHIEVLEQLLGLFPQTEEWGTEKDDNGEEIDVEYDKDHIKFFVNNIAVKVEKDTKTGKIKLTFNSCKVLRQASGKWNKKEGITNWFNKKDIINWFNDFKKNLDECEVFFSQEDLTEQTDHLKITIIPEFVTHIDEYCEENLKYSDNIIVKLANDCSNFDLFEKLKKEYGEDKVKLHIGNHNVTLEKREKDGKPYYLCKFEDYKNIIDDGLTLPANMKHYFSSVKKFKEYVKKAKNNDDTPEKIKEWMKENEEKYGEIHVQFSETDIGSGDNEITFDEYITDISSGKLFNYRETINKIIFKISTDGRNLELLKTLMKNCPGIDIDTKIGEKDIKIDHKGKELCCDYAKYYEILNKNAAVLKGLILTFDSYEDIKKTMEECKPKKTNAQEANAQGADKQKIDTAEWLHDLKEKAKDIEITLTKNDIRNGESLTIYEYNTKVDNETIGLLKDAKDIIFRIATDRSNFELLKQLLKSEHKNKVRTYIDGKVIDIEIRKDENGEQYLRCRGKDHFDKIASKKYLQLRELRAHFKSKEELYWYGSKDCGYNKCYPQNNPKEDDPTKYLIVIG